MHWISAGLTCGVCLLPAVPVFAQTAVQPAEKTVELNRAAKVALVEGDVAAYDAAQKRRSLAVGDFIHEGDSIVTGKDGEVHLDMEDGGYLSVRPNTKMRIIKYQARGESTDTGIFGLLEGGFRSVTGWIGKFNRDKYLVKTKTATVGIRGTDHEPYVIPAGSADGEPGTYDKVNEGGSYITTKAGRVEVAPRQAGFVALDGKTRPRLLKDIPKHFRATRNERLFVGKHAAVQGVIEKRRADRRGEIRQKLERLKAEANPRRAERAEAIRAKAEEAKAARTKAEEGRGQKSDEPTRAEQRKTRIQEQRDAKRAKDEQPEARDRPLRRNADDK